MSKLSDHIEFTIMQDGETTGDAEFDELMVAISDEISKRLENPCKMTGDQADDAFVKFFCDSLRNALLDMSEESINELLAEMVKKFGNPQGTSKT